MPEEICTISKKEGWKLIKLYIGTGATETVINLGVFGDIKIREGTPPD